MNRRTFIKLTGATAVVVTTGISIAKTPEPQWINFTEQLPKPGQRVALFTRFRNNKSQNISLGEVIDTGIAKGYYNYPENTVAIDIGLSYSPDRPIEFGDNDLMIYDAMRSTETELCRSARLWDDYFYPKKYIPTGGIIAKVEKATWIKNKRLRFPYGRCIAPRHGRKVSEYIGRDVAYWFPITEDIPANLPAFPEPKPLKTIRNRDNFITLIKD